MWVIASFVNDDVISSTHATGRLYKYPLSKYKNMPIKLPHECLSNVQQAQDSGLATDICSICKVQTEIFACPWSEIEADKPLLANLTTPQHDNVGWRVFLGGIQQLRGQEEGEGGPLNVHVDQNPAISESISHYCAL